VSNRHPDYSSVTGFALDHLLASFQKICSDDLHVTIDKYDVLREGVIETELSRVAQSNTFVYQLGPIVFCNSSCRVCTVVVDNQEPGSWSQFSDAFKAGAQCHLGIIGANAKCEIFVTMVALLQL
jgi:hypothetical protein